MSLTNPNNIVTEERLNEYHNTILPYLGGMPDILANKFSRADLYSTDEKMIGRWVDGKPLYQRVVSQSNQSSLDIQYDVTSWNIDKVTYLFTMSYSSEGAINPQYTQNGTTDYVRNFMWLNGSSLYLRILVGSNYPAKPVDYITVLQYTKTTDSSVEIGVDTDYSTTEKIIGTWIDGKPIYQKTFNFDPPITISADSWTATTIDSSNIDRIISCTGIHDDGTVYPDISADPTTNNHTVVGFRKGISGAVRYITLQYTKTTD